MSTYTHEIDDKSSWFWAFGAAQRDPAHLAAAAASTAPLAELTARDLHDVGLSWSDIAYEAEKPFWRA